MRASEDDDAVLEQGRCGKGTLREAGQTNRGADIAHNFAYVLWICNFEIIIAKAAEAKDEVRQGAPCEPCSRLRGLLLISLRFWSEQIVSDWKSLQSFAMAFSSFRFDSLQKKDITSRGKQESRRRFSLLWNWKYQRMYTFSKRWELRQPHSHLFWGALSPHFPRVNSFSAKK